MRTRASVLTTALVISSIAFVRPTIVAAQQTPAPPDSTARDTIRRAADGSAFALAVAALMLAAAPGPLVFAMNPDTIPLRFSKNHMAFYVTGGALSGSRGGQDFGGWTASGTVELFRNGMYGEVRVEDFHLPYYVQFRTIRAGYLFRPKPALAGGVTLGYRFTDPRRSENAFEVGFPSVVSAGRGWIRLEPTYIISSQGITWNYRFQTELPVSRELFAGLDMDGKPDRQDAPYFVTLTLLFGWRH